MQNKKGIYLLIFSAILFAVMSTLVRSVSEVGGIHTVFYRFLFSAGIMGFLALTKVFPLHFVRRPLLLLRGLTGGVATFLFYYSIQKLGVGKGTVIVYSYPIFASVFSTLFLKEKISARKWLIIISAFAGFALLSTTQANTSLSVGKYELIAIGGAILSAISVVLVKKLHNTDSTQSIFFAQAIVGFWIFVAPANLSPISLSTNQFLVLFGIGITAVGAQLIMTHAYKFVKVSTGASFYMTVPVLNIFIGWILFHESLTAREIAGSIIVITACFIISRFHKL